MANDREQEIWLSLCFPTCPACKDNGNQCFHKNCPGHGREPLEIEPYKEKVRCNSCGKVWDLKSSRYFCTCGHSFSAEDVSDEVEAIVANAKLVAKEMLRERETRSRINAITNEEIAQQAENKIKKSFGAKVWDLVKGFMPLIVDAVRKWFKLVP